MSAEDAAELKPSHIGICIPGSALTTEVLSRSELPADLHVSRAVFRSYFPTAVGNIDDRSESEVRTEVEAAHTEQQVLPQDDGITTLLIPFAGECHCQQGQTQRRSSKKA